MFDSAPTNLPVEPQAAPQPSVPSPVKQKAQGINVTGSKEPEDIFADIKDIDSGIKTPPSAMTSMTPPPSSPWKLIFGIGIPLAIAVLGVGGWYVYHSYISANTPIAATNTNQSLPTSVPATAEPNGSAPIQNPIPEPDETKKAASQASITLLQGSAKNQLAQEQANMTATSVMPTVPGEISPGVMPGELVQTSTDVTATPENIPAPEGIIPLVKGPDADNDGLTNSEELLLGTDPNAVDSDGDSFADMSELQNGYDPAARGAKLQTSQSLKIENIGSSQILIPKAWQRVPGTGGSIAIQTGTPASINITMEPFASIQTLNDWLLNKYPGTTVADYMSGTNASGADVVYSKDKMTAWMLMGNTVYVFRYATNGMGVNDFGSIFEMIVRYTLPAQ